MSYVKYLKELEKSQFYSKDEIEKIQNKRLEFLIKHSYENIPYFHDLFKKNNLKSSDIKTYDDLVKVPIQRRDSVKNNLDGLVSKSSKKGRLMKDFTSGATTGERLRIYRDRDTINRAIAAEIRAYKWYSIDYLNEKFYYLLGADYDIEWEKKFWKKLKYYFSKTIKLSPIQLDTDNFEVFLSKMKKYDRRVLYGTASGTCRLIKALKARNEKVDIDIFLNTDNLLLKQQRSFIKDFFDCEVYDIYGTSEVWAVAFECPEHNGYHLTSENVIMEIVDDNNERVNPGERGHILLTDLTNYVMPFIRYDIGDIGVLSDEVCQCGRSLHLMKPEHNLPVYRNNQYLLSLNGEKVFLPELSFILNNFKKVSNFQIIQKDVKDIELKLVKEEGYDSDYKDYIKSNLIGKLGDVEITFDYVDDISPNRNGKHKYIKRK
ncbi:MAG: hypothetical protein V5A64_03850 [Candidatus Thermoplasmatota archaeon]